MSDPLVVRRCVKPQGMIYSARTYRIVLNDRGLYLIHIGRAMGMEVKSGNYYSDKLADKMVNKIQVKVMAQLQAREKNINDNDLSGELTSSKSRHFESPTEVQMNFKLRKNGTGKLKVKGKQINIGIDIAQEDVEIANQIVERFK